MADLIILKLDSSGHLILPSDITLNGLTSRKVIWEIGDSRIESFRIAAKDSTNTFFPFKHQPSKDFVTEEELKVGLFTRKKGVWEYQIIWKEKATHTENPTDPKIAVDPIGPFAPISILIAVMVFSILGVRYYRRNIKRK